MKPARLQLIAILFSAAFLVSSACQLSAVLPAAATPTHLPAPAGCEDRTEPTDQDVQYALNFPKGAFRSPEWKRGYTVEDMRASATWTNDEGAVAYLEYLIYSCGYIQQDIDDYFSDDTLQNVILQYYSDVRQTDVCRSRDGLKLHEFSSTYEGEDYLIRLWIKPVNGTRVLYMMMAFPGDSKSDLERYSQAVFPSLADC